MGKWAYMGKHGLNTIPEIIYLAEVTRRRRALLDAERHSPLADRLLEHHGFHNGDKKF